MEKSKFNTFSFNNFKPFGKKMQSFSKKPITLIYGPNSIGKSSLLQSVLYLEYLNNLTYFERCDSGALNFNKSYFAGDELDFGGFSNFIHKKDWEKTIEYTITIKKSDDLEKIFPLNYTILKKFNKDGMFEFLENMENSDDTLLNNIQKRLKIYQIKDGCYNFSSAIRSAVKKEELVLEDIKKHFIEYYNLRHEPTANTLFYNWLNSESRYEDVVYRKDNKKLDLFDKYLLYLFDLLYAEPIFNNADEINKLNQKAIDLMFSFIPYFKYITSINSIQMTSVIKMEENRKLVMKQKFKIDNEFLCSIVYKQNNFKIYETFITLKLENKFFKDTLNYLTSGQAQDIFSEKKIIFKANVHSIPIDMYDFIQARTSKSLSAHNHLEELSLGFANNVIALLKSNIQYIGPLRYIPSRNDYYKMVKNTSSKPKKEEKKKIGFDPVKNMRYLENYIKKIDLIGNRIFKNFFKYIRILMLPLYIPLLFSIILFVVLPKMIISFLSDSQLIMNQINIFRSRSNKLSSANAKTSEKMWKDLLSSEELQEQINNWLGDSDKLKTTYKIMHLENVEGRVNFIDMKKNTAVSIKEIGLGISQVLPILISSIATKNYKIFIEQPELHLHPSIQAELADEFIRSYKENNNEFMIETHSEHLLLRIMKRMRHTAEGRIDKDDVLALTPDDVCLLYVDSDGENTFVNELELDEDGTLLDPWPNGFFEEGHRERFD